MLEDKLSLRAIFIIFHSCPKPPPQRLLGQFGHRYGLCMEYRYHALLGHQIISVVVLGSDHLRHKADAKMMLRWWPQKTCNGTEDRSR